MRSLHTRLYLLLAILLVAGIADAQVINHTKNKESKMSAIQRNKEVIQKLYSQALNKKNMELLRDLVSEDYTGLKGEKGAAGFTGPIMPLINAFPDIQWNLEELIGEDDKVFVRWKIQGTHTGQFANFKATGKTVSNTGMAVYELKDGKIINAQVLTDRLGFLQEIGALPLDLTSLKKAYKESTAPEEH